jgi:hypothetical protein
VPDKSESPNITKKKKKSPSRVRRDQKRIQEYRRKKNLNKKSHSKPDSKLLPASPTHTKSIDLPPGPSFIISHYNQHSPHVPLKLYPSRIVGSDNGKPKTTGIPPGSESAPISVDSALNATVLDVKQQLVAQLHLDHNIPLLITPDNIWIHHVASTISELSAANPNLYTLNFLNCLPITTFTLDKRIPKYTLIYDIIIYPELL